MHYALFFFLVFKLCGFKRAGLDIFCFSPIIYIFFCCGNYFYFERNTLFSVVGTSYDFLKILFKDWNVRGHPKRHRRYTGTRRLTLKFSELCGIFVIFVFQSNVSLWSLLPYYIYILRSLPTPIFEMTSKCGQLIFFDELCALFLKFIFNLVLHTLECP